MGPLRNLGTSDQDCTTAQSTQQRNIREGPCPAPTVCALRLKPLPPVATAASHTHAAAASATSHVPQRHDPTQLGYRLTFATFHKNETLAYLLP